MESKGTRSRIDASCAALSGSSFEDVDLTGAHLDDVNLSGVVIGNVNVSDMKIMGVSVQALLNADRARQ